VSGNVPASRVWKGENTMLEDSFNREFPYLRLSITEACNFRCQYCLPDGYICKSKPDFLNIDEIRRIATAFSELGTWKIRLTGGEPTIRKDFTEIVSTIADIPGIKQLAFTTNGYRLRKNAQKWKDAGLDNINISVDSLNPEKFCEITGHDRLNEIIEGIKKAIEVGFEKIKTNVVLLKNVNDNELSNYLDWIKDTPVSVRFIELMQTGDNLEYFNKYHISTDFIKEELLKNGWGQEIRAQESGPAVTFSHPDYAGKIGIIAPYSKDFCKGCNRLRTTSTGDLRLCLFGNSGISLRHLLQYDDQKEELKQLITAQLQYKCSSHFLDFGDTGITPHLASVGG
jgi:cyclic pyranopterin phosphate synthase